MANLSSSVFKDCLVSLLRPIVRFCIRHSVKHQELLAVSKALFVEEASRELLRRSTPHSVSRLSVMTGLQRRDVDRLVKTPGFAPRTPNLVARVVGRWASDARYLGKNGRPRPLLTEGRESEFARLVHAVSRDLNHHTVEFEMVRVGLAVREGERLVLEVPYYARRDDLLEGFGMLGENIEDISVAVEENLSDPRALPNLHAATEYDNIPPERAEEIRRWLLRLGRKIHDQARRYLSKFDRDASGKDAGSGARTRVVIGTFSRIEQRQEPRKRGK